MKKYFWVLLVFLSSCSFFVKNEQNIIVQEVQSVPEMEVKIEEKIYDFESDDSLIKYVSPEVSFSQKDYIPKDLVFIAWEYIIDLKWNQTLRQEAKEQLDILWKEFFGYFWVKLKIVSAYRSYEYQVGIKAGGCSDLFCAKAGHSEHQTGWAIDIFEATNEKEFLNKSDLKKYFEWMEENAHHYWFHNSYQKGEKNDGYVVEPWHWRYVWKEFAQELHQKNMTFSEFYTDYMINK